jgi:hypothetical protein
MIRNTTKNIASIHFIVFRFHSGEYGRAEGVASLRGLTSD